MSFEFPSEFVLFDLEYTSWPGAYERNWSGPGEHREIIQIGAIRVRDMTEVDAFLEYIKPAINPTLSEFIIEFTGISQDDIETKGLSFAEAYTKLQDFVGKTPAFCWGEDVEVFEENCGLTGISFALDLSQFQNARPLLAADFRAVGIDIEESTSGTLIEEFTGEPGRRAHDALNDMRNLLEAFHALRAGIKKH